MSFTEILNKFKRSVEVNATHAWLGAGMALRENHGRNLVQTLTDIRDTPFIHHQGNHAKNEDDVEKAKEWAEKQRKTKECVEAFSQHVRKGNQDRNVWVKELDSLRNELYQNRLDLYLTTEQNQRKAKAITEAAIDVEAKQIVEVKTLQAKYTRLLGGS